MNGMSNFNGRARGFSLMEVLIASALSLLVTLTMIALMGNSLGTTSRMIRMTKLSDDLRSALMLMSRDVRRSNYTADSINCFANPDCLEDGSVYSPGDVQISENNQCFVYSLDRSQNADETVDAAGGFRRSEIGGIGVIEMWVGADESILGLADPCQEDAGADPSPWVAVTDVNDLNITNFSVDDDLSYTEVVLEDTEGNQYWQKVRKLRLSLTGRVIEDQFDEDDPMRIERTVGDIIKLRNNLYLPMVPFAGL